jgi:hypothetical protein
LYNELVLDQISTKNRLLFAGLGSLAVICGFYNTTDSKRPYVAGVIYDHSVKAELGKPIKVAEVIGWDTVALDCYE